MSVGFCSRRSRRFLLVRPAPGYRDVGRKGWKGIAGGNGGNGYSWSASISHSSGIYSGIYMQRMGTNLADERGHGFQLRCLSE
ncbi:hypothetical protein [uncultured Rikenella sp.]|uniref:hypothetical protein n=1 Tax=uncultured Rikenella sp. TaxID=368003 RepID=UPI00272C1EC3|nr:hypothetical protein [uncultured Rikenella sp.]